MLIFPYTPPIEALVKKYMPCLGNVSTIEALFLYLFLRGIEGGMGDPVAPVVKNEDDNTLTEFGWGAFTREPPSY